MLKKKNVSHIIVMVLFVSCFLNSCQKEEILEIQDDQTIIQKRTISFEELNVKLNKYTKFTTHQERADGDEFITSLETDNIIEFETQDETTYTLKANTTADNETGFTNIIFVEKNEQLEKYLLKYEPTDAWITARLTDVNILYSGHIIILDFDGNVLAESEVVAGVTVSKRTSNMACYTLEGYTDIFFETYYVLVEVPCEDEEPEDDEIDEGDSGDGGGTTDTSNDGNDSNGSGTGNDNGDNSNDNGTGDNTNTGDDGTPIFTEPVLGDNDGDLSLLYQLNEFLCIPISINEFNNIDIEVVQQIIENLQNNPPESTCVDVDFEENIIYDFEGKDCQKQILKDLVALSSPFTELINNTFNSTDIVNLKYSVGNLSNANALATSHYYGDSNNFTLFIVFDNDFLETATDLGIITVTLHELVHSYLLNLYLKGILIATSSDYNNLLNGFINFYTNQNQETFEILDNEIHNSMNDFISTMANSIYNYANNNEIEGVSADFSEQLSWGSMTGTDLFNVMLTGDEQIINNNIFAYEQSNLSESKGSPCNN